MNLSDLMEGLRRSAAERTKFVGITLTQVEIEPILKEYDELCAARDRLDEQATTGD